MIIPIQLPARDDLAMSCKILLIEDEPGLCVTLSDRLQKEGYAIDICNDGESGFQKAKEDYDLVLLDLMLPKKNGYDLCRDVRQMGVRTPILMLTARDQVADKVLGLKSGADDYLTKPFEMPELLARIEALLRRSTRPSGALSPVYQFGSVKVDFIKTEIHRNGETVPFSCKEFQLLRYLIDHKGETLNRGTLLHEVWGYSAIPNTRTVDVHIAWLRQKLEADPKQPHWILTVHGIGYKFAE
jgi:two-component system, OmpR family, alkaline phosphatase synthesis response regulator PhoP